MYEQCTSGSFEHARIPYIKLYLFNKQSNIFLSVLDMIQNNIFF